MNSPKSAEETKKCESCTSDYEILNDRKYNGLCDYCDSVIISMSVNFEDRYQFTKNNELRFPMWYRQTVCLLYKYLKPLSQYYFVPEISQKEYSQDGTCQRLHIHGYVKFHSPLDYATFFINVQHKMNKEYCRIEHKKIINFSAYIKYFKKQEVFMRPYTESYKLRYSIVGAVIPEGYFELYPKEEEKVSDKNIKILSALKTQK